MKRQNNELDEFASKKNPNPEIGMKVEKTKNKGASSLQITAEQIIRASHAHATDEVQISDLTFDTPEELEEYKTQKRKSFEIQTQRHRYNFRAWFKYADWEEHLGEFERARNIYKRAIEIDYKNVSLWLRYAEMEIKGKFINHARNVWEQAIKLLPRIEQLWFKYTLMEEMLGNYIGAREIFKNWMTWNPSENAWMAFAKFEERMGEINNSRMVLFEFITKNKNVASYMKVAKFEERNGNFQSCREIYESALSELGEEALDEDFFYAFITFEVKMKDIERARVLLKYGLDNISKAKMRKKLSNIKETQFNNTKKDAVADIIIGDDNNDNLVLQCPKLYTYYTMFEKMYGSVDEVDELIVNKRRKYYEQLLKEDSSNYDIWFNYIKMEEDCLDNVYLINDIVEAHKRKLKINNSTNPLEVFYSKIRDLYERAISNIPIKEEKGYWKRYIYLWINYAMFEELVTLNTSRAEKIYMKALEIIPNKKFTFSKIWILFSEFLIRRKDLTKARKTLGQIIGLSPNKKIFQHYINLELQLGNLDRCRKLYERQVECFPQSSDVWLKYVEFEESLEEFDRSRALLEAAENLILDRPELIWKMHINLEIRANNHDKVRELYKILINKSKHVRVWLSYAKFEQEDNNFPKARMIYKDAHEYFKQNNLNSERAEIIFAWLEFEKKISLNYADSNVTNIKEVERMVPVKVKKRRLLNEENTGESFDNGVGENWEEYYDYVFYDEKEKPKSMKFLQSALEWKKLKEKDISNINEL